MFVPRVVQNVMLEGCKEWVSRQLTAIRFGLGSRRGGARILMATLGMLAMGGVGSATAATAGAAVLVPLQMCTMPGLGDAASWLLPLLRQGLTYAGPTAATYGIFFAPAEGGRMSPRRWILAGLLMFGAGLLWSDLAVYFGQEVLGGDEAFINSATCGIDTGA